MAVLLISSDTIDTQMAGPGIRYWEFAKHLSQKQETILLTPNRSSLTHSAFQIRQHTKSTLSAALKLADVVVTQGYLYALGPLIVSDKPLVIDLYDPLPIELLEHHSHLPLNAAQLSQSYCVARTKLLLRRGDFFLYSHDRQREYWLGMLSAVGRVNHQHYRKDPEFSTLFGRVPYGIPDASPVQTTSVLRGEDAPFSESDTIILWGGGLWKWFDPAVVIRAMHEISTTRQDIKLLFLGAKRAASDTTGITIAYATEDAMRLSHQLGLYNRTVFFHETWIPYDERQNYFLDADIGISTHFDSLETRLSFRTRILDYLWTGLPIITTAGDYLSDLVRQHQVGITISPSNVVQMKDAILRLSDDAEFVEQCRENIRRIRPQFAWSEAIKPLEQFCSHPQRTSHLSRPALWAYLAQFYANTGKDLFKYHGYSKILTKLRKKLFL